jgi:predicted nucleic acid-binding protein
VNPESDILVLDSYALLAYLGGEPGRYRIREALAAAKDGKCRLLLCTINLGEVLYMTERRRGFEAAQNVQALIESLPIEILDATRKLVLNAAHIKANHPISYADAFVVALAQGERGTILTGDPEYRAVEEIVEVEWLTQERTP